jgi:hypothetical protein
VDVPFVFVTAVRAAAKFKNDTRMFPVYVKRGLALPTKNRDEIPLLPLLLLILLPLLPFILLPFLLLILCHGVRPFEL